MSSKAMKRDGGAVKLKCIILSLKEENLKMLYAEYYIVSAIYCYSQYSQFS